jgi:hypothetical protein
MADLVCGGDKPMQSYDKYWLTTLGRGVLAILVSAAIAPLTLILASSLTTLILFPLVLTASILCLSLYGLLDSTLVLVTGAALPRFRYAHWALMVQGMVGAAVILLIALQPIRFMHLQVLVVLAAIQAMCTALADSITAVHARQHHVATGWLLACSSISLLCGVALLFGRSLPPLELTNLICCYLLLLGGSFLLLSIRMLSREGHLLHPYLQRLAHRKPRAASAETT